MPQKPNMLQKFLVEEDGAALAEYGILVAIVAVTFFGGKISEKFSQMASSI